MSWSTFRQFTPLVWIVILGTFMVRTSYYMVWPFLSILLYREYDLSATFIGLLLGGSMALSTLSVSTAAGSLIASGGAAYCWPVVWWR